MQVSVFKIQEVKNSIKSLMLPLPLCPPLKAKHWGLL